MSFQADAFQNDAFQVEGGITQNEIIAILDSQNATLIAASIISESIVASDSQSAASFPEQVQDERVTVAAVQQSTLIINALQTEILTEINDINIGVGGYCAFQDDAFQDDAFQVCTFEGDANEVITVIDSQLAQLIAALPDQHDGLVKGPYPKKHKYDLISPELYRKAKLRKDLITALQDGSYLPDLLGPSNKTVKLQRPTPPELPQLSSPPVQVGDLSKVIVSLRQSPDDDEEAMEALLRVL